MTEITTAKTELYDRHIALGGKMVAFAGYMMPVQYKAGIMQEHLHTREKAGLFDVSHMGQVHIKGADIGAYLEKLVPGAIEVLKPGKQKYAFFTNEQGGILDDLMIARLAEDHFYLVVNAGCKQADFDHLKAHAPDTLSLEMDDQASLLALQGPKAVDVLATLIPEVADMAFMSIIQTKWQSHKLLISRSGYTGEDGFEISVPNAGIGAFFDALTIIDDVLPIGLGARDSLRLEAGLCLYGQDLAPDITPAEADLNWAVAKRRREQGGFIGDAVLVPQWEKGPERVRVGLAPQGRAPVRAGAPLFDQASGGTQIGMVTSGGFGPSFGAPVAMGYVPYNLKDTETLVYADVRGKRLPCQIHTTPFVPHNYKR